MLHNAFFSSVAVAYLSSLYFCYSQSRSLFPFVSGAVYGQFVFVFRFVVSGGQREGMGEKVPETTEVTAAEHTECPKMYRNSVLYPLKYGFAVFLVQICIC